jgi:cation transport regulator ChaC
VNAHLEFVLTLNRAQQKRERNAKKDSAKEPTSQLKTNASANQAFVCVVCRQPYMSTTREEQLREHVESKHGKSGQTFEQCFPTFVK